MKYLQTLSVSRVASIIGKLFLNFSKERARKINISNTELLVSIMEEFNSEMQNGVA